MTTIARLKACGPCDLAVVTSAAELALSNRIHGDLTGTRLHLEWSWMAGVTFVPDPVKPVREDRRRYSSLATFSFENDVAVHGQCGASNKDSNEKREKKRPETEDRRPPSFFRRL